MAKVLAGSVPSEAVGDCSRPLVSFWGFMGDPGLAEASPPSPPSSSYGILPVGPCAQISPFYKDTQKGGWGFPSGKESACQCRRHRFDS